MLPNKPILGWYDNIFTKESGVGDSAMFSMVTRIDEFPADIRHWHLLSTLQKYRSYDHTVSDEFQF